MEYSSQGLPALLSKKGFCSLEPHCLQNISKAYRYIVVLQIRIAIVRIRLQDCATLS